MTDTTRHNEMICGAIVTAVRLAQEYDMTCDALLAFVMAAWDAMDERDAEKNIVRH